MPTFTEYIDSVSQAVEVGTRRVYDSWRRVADTWGDRRLDEPNPMEIRQLAQWMRGQVVVRPNAPRVFDEGVGDVDRAGEGGAHGFADGGLCSQVPQQPPG